VIPIARIVLLAFVSSATTVSVAQKVKVGYDKSTDFSKFKSYSWSAPAMPPTRPALFEAVTARVEVELRDKGFAKVERDGDLTLTPSGGMEYGFSGEAANPYSPTYGGAPPALNATMWTGTTGPSSAGVWNPEGTLILTFVDRSSNKIVWSGSVKQKLDLEKKNKSLELADKAVIKLLAKFPGKK